MTTAEGNITQLQTDVVTAQTTANTASSGVATNATAITGLDTRVTTLESHEDNKFNSIAVADAYNAATSYAEGDIVTYNGNRYVCTTATSGEPWDADHWSAEDVQTVLDTKISRVRKIGEVITDGVKTRSQIYDEIFAITQTITEDQIFAYISWGTYISTTDRVNLDAETITISRTALDLPDSVRISFVNLKESSSEAYLVVITTAGTMTISDLSNGVPTSGTTVAVWAYTA